MNPLPLQGKRLGVLISARPESAAFEHGIRLAAAAVEAGVQVYLYCIDDAVTGAEDSRIQNLRSRGLKVFACAYAAQRRQLPLHDKATFSGLGALSELIARTDRFISFHA